ncbi:MAG: SGNH/GDSL hydrolase family protein [Candidatus Micrarchaeota archaeon]
MKAIIAVALTLMLFGCINIPGGSPEKAGNATGGLNQDTQDAGNGPPDAQTGDQGTPDTPETDAANNETADTEAGTGGGTSGQTNGKTDVLLLGRSVAYGWSEYMGLEWQEDESYLGEYDGKTIRYLHMDYPPDIDDSAIRAIDTYDPDVVFFKLCFVDFGSEYGDMLADDEQYVENVYQEAVVNKHKKLIVGNALPQVARDTTPGLKQNHQEYNRWLSEFAATHDGVYVLDLYGLLSDSGGALKAGYASSPEDSHPNTEGYAKITPALMDKIEEAQAG